MQPRSCHLATVIESTTPSATHRLFVNNSSIISWLIIISSVACRVMHLCPWLQLLRLLHPVRDLWFWSSMMSMPPHHFSALNSEGWTAYRIGQRMARLRSKRWPPPLLSIDTVSFWWICICPWVRHQSYRISIYHIVESNHWTML